MISRQELQAMLQSSQADFIVDHKKNEKENTKRLDALMKQCDQNGDGGLDFTEFITCSINYQKALNSERLDKLFKMLDKDRNGSISFAELKSFYADSAREEKAELIQKAFEEADVNKDDKVTKKEFKEVMNKLLT